MYKSHTITLLGANLLPAARLEPNDFLNREYKYEGAFAEF